MKKKIVALVTALTLTYSLAGCTPASTQTSSGVITPGTYNYTSVPASNILEFVDLHTGIHYFVYSCGNAGGMTPRLNPDGSVMCEN